MKNNHMNTAGFSLASLMIAVFVVTISVSSVFISQFSTLQSATLSTDYLTATNLAREGLEAVRNIRDSNWLYHSGSKRSLDGDAARDNWNNGFDGTDSYTQYSSYLGNANKNQDRSDAVIHYFIPFFDYNTTNIDERYTWKLQHITEVGTEQSDTLLANYMLTNQYLGSLVYYNTDENYPNIYLQNTNFNSNTTGLDTTKFHRIVEIRYRESYDNDGGCSPSNTANCKLNAHDNIIDIRSIVAWNDNNNKQQFVVLKQQLTDWFRRDNKS